MVTIWRVENKAGEGCYQGQDTAQLLFRHRNTWTHPPPELDSGIRRFPRAKEVSGFLTREQASRWFSDTELVNLRQLGFELKEVEVEKITDRSWWQCLAIKESTLAGRLFDRMWE